MSDAEVRHRMMLKPISGKRSCSEPECAWSTDWDRPSHFAQNPAEWFNVWHESEGVLYTPNRLALGSPQETRSVSETGGEKGVKDERHSYFPREALDLIARVYTFGAKKYADHNWRKGYKWSYSYDALQRHLTAFWAREENDPESGLSHLGHAGFHIFALIVFSTNPKYRQFDDRYQEAA